VTALCIEVQVEAGQVEPLDLLRAKQAEQQTRSAYALALHHERCAIRIAQEHGSVKDCLRCLPCTIGSQVLLCSKHTFQLDGLRRAVARRITAQRALATASYALDRIRKETR
jgi:uncharacterized ParB-like nuclease family protein